MESLTPVLMTLGLLLVSGIMLGMVFSRIGLPRVAAYTIVGVLFSPSMLGGVVGIEITGWTEPVTEAALAIVAYLIGGEVRLDDIRTKGWMIFSAATGGALGAAVLVFITLLWYQPVVDGIQVLSLILAFAAIATSTSPGSTIAVLHQYHAKGPMSSSLLGITAIDDGLAILIIAIMLSFTAGVPLAQGMETVLLEIVGGGLLGLAAGSMLAGMARMIRIIDLLLPLELGAVLLVYGLAEHWHLSPLLAAMSFGFGARLFVKGGGRLFVSVERLGDLTFVILFAIAGAHFNPETFVQYFDLILLYFLARMFGKIGGTTIGAYIAKAPKPLVRWLGLGMVPQAGVAIGFALLISQYQEFQSVSHIIVNVVLASTLLAEIIGPLLTRYALIRTGEIKQSQ
jgi:Kef-type K+ transport system membrane component KefB